MVAERERACDQEVLRLGNEPRTYAEGILRVCALYLDAPLKCVSGVTGADLKKRVHAILAGSIEADLSPTRKAMLAAFAILSVALPLLIGVCRPMVLRAQSELSAPLLPERGARFRSVSIERCRTYISGGIENPASGILVANCLTAAALIQMAYDREVDVEIPVSGEPVWADSGNYRYRIDAQANRRASLATMKGPMLQGLLAERFGLKIRRVTQESAMYELGVQKSGAKLHSAEGSCSGGFSFGPIPPPPPSPGHANCLVYPVSGSTQFARLDAQSLGMKDFCRLLSGPLGRPVIDRSGISGKFDFHLKFAGDDTPAALSRLYPSLPEVLTEQLGLKLNPITGPRDFLVIDRLEKPLPRQGTARRIFFQ